MPDGCAQFVNGSDLWRLDLTSGEVAQLAPDLGLSLSLSPDEQTLAYRAYGDRELVLRDLLTGQARAVPVAGGQPAGGFGRLTWSPDGKQLLFMAAAEPCGPGPQTLVHVDAATLAQRAVLHVDDGRFTLLEWPEAGRALLAAAERPVWLDPITGALTPGATPTPGPAP